MSSSPLVPLTLLKQELPVKAGLDRYDEQLQRLARTATAQVEAWTRRRFTRAAVVEYVSARDTARRVLDLAGDGGWGDVVLGADQVMPLQGWPVDTGQPFEVRYDPADRLWPDSTVLRADLDYQVDGPGNRLLVLIPTRSRLRAFKLSYTAGWTAGDDGSLWASLPDDLKEAALLQCRYLFRRINTANLGVTVDRKDGATPAANWATAALLAPEALPLLAPYRRTLTSTL